MSLFKRLVKFARNVLALRLRADAPWFDLLLLSLLYGRAILAQVTSIGHLLELVELVYFSLVDLLIYGLKVCFSLLFPVVKLHLKP